LFSKSELWDGIEKLASYQGVRLFDIEMPSQKKGVLRIFISSVEKGKAGAGISVEECEALSKRISVDPDLGADLEEFALEVSSPGINRNLRRPEHFCNVVGERIKFTVKNSGNAANAYTGLVVACDGTTLDVEVEGHEGKSSFSLEDILKARVDYLFN